MTDQTRQYRMRRRAESQLETRRRITESAVELHGTLGPAHTSMSAVAAHAGVRRSTLYRHFPDEAALFDACSAHWAAANPPPDLATWAAIDQPDARLATALDELYAFYARVAPMLANLIRDEQTEPVVRERFGAFHGYLDAAGDTLLAGRRVRGAARLRVQAALAHALAFSTWQSLVQEQGLEPADARRLMGALVDAAGARPAVRSAP
ncbi:MAG TPA: helix-turn-helix domain-containing protein [Solirubrobacteraceae bacterium]|nr:helix-turn-helix domain-containing protein [Solirubrobacteraceae bacterium]